MTHIGFAIIAQPYQSVLCLAVNTDGIVCESSKKLHERVFRSDTSFYKELSVSQTSVSKTTISPSNTKPLKYQLLKVLDQYLKP